jgi:Tfp pilus assembly protein PilV
MQGRSSGLRGEPPRFRVCWRGLTLVEVVIAIFIITGAMLTLMSLLDSGLTKSSTVEKRMTASDVAERRIAAIRSWAQNSTSWDSGAGFPSGNDSTYPVYLITQAMINDTTTPPFNISSPCTTQGGSTRVLTRSYCKLQVNVTYPPYGSGDILSLTTLIDDPPRSWRASNPIVITPSGSAPSTVPPNTPFTFTATGYDSNNAPIPDLFFKFYVLPGTGDGSVSNGGDGQSCSFSSNYTTLTGAVIDGGKSYTGSATSTCTLQARAVYMGVEKWGTYSLTLQ